MSSEIIHIMFENKFKVKQEYGVQKLLALGVENKCKYIKESTFYLCKMYT